MERRAVYTAVRTSSLRKHSAPDMKNSTVRIKQRVKWSLVFLICLTLCIIINRRLRKPVRNDNLESAKIEAPREIGPPLAGKNRILCIVPTGPFFHRTRAIHAKNTWGTHCDKIIFPSSAQDPVLGTTVLPRVREGRNWLWNKTKESFIHVWKHYRDDFEWFLKADDNSYVIVENLRYFLQDKDPNEPHYYGCRMQWMTPTGTNFGGAGYVLSREAVRRFLEEALPSREKCRQDHGGDEDGELGICLANIGIYAEDTRDTLGRHRFMFSSPAVHVNPYNSKYMHNYNLMDLYYDEGKGSDCCSDTPISFHDMTPGNLYALEYILYRLRVYGTSKNPLN